MRFSFRPQIDNGSDRMPVYVEPCEDGVAFELGDDQRTIMIAWDDWETLVRAVRSKSNP